MNRTRATRDAATSSPKTAGAPRWRDKERARTRKQILSAARRVFADRGFYKSRLDDIARLAGLGKGTLYSYFSNKADLVAAVLEDTIDQQLRTVEPSRARPVAAHG
jgi:AcrR family transcriptional regulator